MGEYVDVLKGVLRVTFLEALAIQGRGQLAEDICPHCQGPPTMWVIGGKCKPAVRCECKEGHSWVR
jgi:hypothetical protein